MSEPAPVMGAYSTTDDVRRLVEQYCREQRSARLPLFTVLPSFRWQEACPREAEGPGCYAIYGVNGWLLYVGMSVTNIANRIRKHGDPVVQRCWFWTAHPPVTFDIIPVPERWDAPSLEEFLTCKTARYNLKRE